jgi:hypothetical protein
VAVRHTPFHCDKLQVVELLAVWVLATVVSVALGCGRRCTCCFRSSRRERVLQLVVLAVCTSFMLYLLPYYVEFHVVNVFDVRNYPGSARASPNYAWRILPRRGPPTQD